MGAGKIVDCRAPTEHDEHALLRFFPRATHSVLCRVECLRPYRHWNPVRAVSYEVPLHRVLHVYRVGEAIHTADPSERNGPETVRERLLEPCETRITGRRCVEVDVARIGQLKGLCHLRFEGHYRKQSLDSLFYGGVFIGEPRAA